MHPWAHSVQNIWEPNIDMNNSSTLTLDTIVVAVPDQVSADLGDETIILNGQTGLYYGLEGIGIPVWKLIQNPISIQTICDTIQAEYDVEPGHCQDDITSLMVELLDEGMVEIDGQR